MSFVTNTLYNIKTTSASLLNSNYSSISPILCWNQAVLPILESQTAELKIGTKRVFCRGGFHFNFHTTPPANIHPIQACQHAGICLHMFMYVEPITLNTREISRRRLHGIHASGFVRTMTKGNVAMFRSCMCEYCRRWGIFSLSFYK